MGVGLIRCLVGLIWLMTSAWSQTTTATLLGRVADAFHAPVPHARLTVHNLSTGEQRTSESDEQGAYAILNILPGVYELSVECAGFRRLREPDIDLEVGQQLQLNVQLDLGGVNEAVEVKAGP